MGISIEIAGDKTINFAACQCGRQKVASVQINDGNGQEAILRIWAVPEFIYEYKEKIALSGKQTLQIEPKLQLDAAFYRQELIEAKEGTIHVALLDENNTDNVLAFAQKQVHLQPYLQWNKNGYLETMTVFMQPNDPLIAGVLKRAGELANEEKGRMSGYQEWQNTTPKKQAEWIYRALQEENIHYLCPPPGYEEASAWGQKIRIPHYVLHEDMKQGTCIDLALLYASCLEAVSLNPIIFLIPGHAFAGVWLEDNRTLPHFCCEDRQKVLESIEDGSLVPVECTFFTDNLGWSFEDAINVGIDNMKKTSTLTAALDVEYGRDQGFVPVYTFTDQPFYDIVPDTGSEPDTQAESVNMTPAKYRVTKLDRLVKQAMDFSMKNAMLDKNVLGAEIAFQISSKQFFEEGYTDEALFMQMKQSDISKEKAEAQMYELQSADRQVRRECGRGTLYLAVNELLWLPNGEEPEKRAPLYFCPAEIYRNIRGEYLFRIKADEMFFNPVLKELLHQDYSIDLSDILDQPGETYKKQTELLTYAVSAQENWKIVEDVAGLAIYHVPNEAIWKGLQDKKLLEHDIVRGILDGAMTWDNTLPADEAETEDTDAVYAFQADSSQSEVIRSAAKRRAQIVIGPAGNGKSQTIANLMTEQIKKGKHVLFVAEKLSAMEVIAAMLEKVGLAPFCLMLPDGKNSVTAVSNQIDATLRFIENYSYSKDNADYQEKQYREAAEKLQKFYAYMKTPGECGQSLADLLEEYEKYRDIKVQIGWHAAGKALNHPEAESTAAAFEEALRMCQVVNTEYLPYIRLLDMAEEEKNRAASIVEQAVNRLDAMRRQKRYFEKLLGISLEHDGEKEGVRRALTYATALLKCPVIGESLQIDKQDEDSVLRELLILSRTMLATATDSDLHVKAGEQLWSKIDEITEFNQKQPLDIDALENMKSSMTGMYVGGLTANQKAQMSATLKFRQYCQQLLGLMKDRDEEEQKALLKAATTIGRGEGSELLDEAKLLCELYKKYMEVQGDATELVIQDEKTFALIYPKEIKAVLFTEWQKCQGSLTDLKIYENVSKRAGEIGIGGLLRQIEQKVRQGELETDQVLTVFRKCRCEYNIKDMQQNHPELEIFAHIDYKVCLQQYKENEQLLRAHLHKVLLDEVVALMPDVKEGTEDSQEPGILQKLIRRSNRQVSIRNLFEEAPHVMQQLFPCMLMGPESVAEYIPADAPQFDMVIFDEASQLPTYKALIPVSRGNSCLFIGDEKQLTPTTFFQKNIEDEDGSETPTEAILEDAIVTSMPRQMLKYHYRSQHESLVAFSNERYYHGEMVTFPEPTTEIAGVDYIYVEDGCYDRGGERNNLKEAERVVALVQEIYGGLPEETTDTLGVITFNLAQMKLIKSLIHEAISNGEAQSRQMSELVDVVNLEACQGKEWDRTILSTAYGKDAEGNFSTNLGPMSREDGGNRLNVMITRSRKQLYVVTSMKPEMFDGEQKAGLRDVRDFLAFARGDYSLDSRETENGAGRSGLTASVAAILEKKGYTVHTNIGSSSCKVDIGVVAKDGKSYQLGILLDHFSNGNYYVRDEEIIKPSILGSKGWQIYRLHAVNWYENADYEMAQIERLLK